MNMNATNRQMKGNNMKTHTFAAAALTIGFAVGLVAAPALVAAGLSMIGAFSALITVMQACYFVSEYSR